MDLERAMELLNEVIDHISAAESCEETIKQLLQIGFTEEELVNVFNFSESDVENALEDMDEYKD